MPFLSSQQGIKLTHFFNDLLYPKNVFQELFQRVLIIYADALFVYSINVYYKSQYPARCQYNEWSSLIDLKNMNLLASF